eukprot:8115784-Heterocapsa_arctica.AAC.1
MSKSGPIVVFNKWSTSGPTVFQECSNIDCWSTFGALVPHCCSNWGPLLEHLWVTVETLLEHL